VKLSAKAVEVEATRVEAMAARRRQDPHDVKHVAPKRKLGAVNSPRPIDQIADRRGVDRNEHGGPIRPDQACDGADAGRIEAAAQDGWARSQLCLRGALGVDANCADGTFRDPKEPDEIDRRAWAHPHGKLAPTVSVEVGGAERFADAPTGTWPMTAPQHLVEVPARAELTRRRTRRRARTCVQPCLDGTGATSLATSGTPSPSKSPVVLARTQFGAPADDEAEGAVCADPLPPGDGPGRDVEPPPPPP
jgi:hypothetical protein